jgi:hypothetical protein
MPVGIATRGIRKEVWIMEFGQEFEYEQDYPYVDEERTE